MKIHIIDYGMGNLRSIQKGLERVGATAILTSDQDELASASAIVLPGVGAFGDAMKNLETTGLIDIMAEKVAGGTPFLGICLGLQLLFEESTEGGTHQGLGLLPGRVDKFPSSLGVKIPHMGWNELVFKEPDHFLLNGIETGTYVYFVHSYHAHATDTCTVATAHYGYEFPAIVRNEQGNLVATQFHPEKSSRKGLHMLSNFLKFTQKCIQ
ncbi:imidazole glycerol phosphate synthase subunit HisH [Candidatus Bathyarchaeota archaeon]|nr:imidazole glycerol phosphate synthase subunit HisH [Candidatus Bathyarchaeota archaeon]